MITIGLIGEDPNDTQSITNLLSPEFHKEIKFITLLKRINGSQLDNQKTKHLLRKEIEFEKPDLVIAIRDLDSHEQDNDKREKINEFFIAVNRISDGKSIKLLNIHEIEALILADIETFNSIYKTNISITTAPQSISEPKEFLKSATYKAKGKKYNESHNPEIFAHLKIEIIKSKCTYFNTFIERLSKALI
ncbi:DUF4276 family protein [Rufibacter immobilis]|uniref:DUF4276 family protein n=1 Tax=Rufibacter immobilis TaxID=1348778 RepID=A0A3M9MVI1_9BACT|nr:DUF4276 family protein [Rufibacter immobilis]RNI29552.1 DUF4276 family protein [Rufibacter immobilis]